MPSHVSSMVRACGDFSLYGEVTGQRTRRTVAYFALLVVISSLIITAGVVFELRRVMRKELEPELERLPVITIQNHLASANVPQPWVKTFSDSSGLKTIVAIDTTGQTTGFKFDEQGFILTRTQLLLKNPQNPYLQPLNLSDVDDVVVDATMLRRWMSLGLKIVGGACAVLLPLWFTAAKLVQALLFALVGLIVNSTRRRKLGFGQIFTVSIYALTPAVALDVLRSLFFSSLPWFWLIYSAVACAFVVLAMKRIPDEDNTITVPLNQPSTAAGGVRWPGNTGGMPGV